MNISFYNGVSGVKTYQFGIDVLGDNIANVNTTAYKAQNVDFQTLFASGNTSTYTGMSINSPVAQSDIGLGGSEAVTTMNTKQGSIKHTDNLFDMAIEGDGFFRIQGENKEIFYTRAGNFLRDSDEILVNSNGEKVLGIDAKTLTKSKDKWIFNANIDTSNIFNNVNTTSPIKIPKSIIFPAQASTKLSLSGNLNNSDIADNVKKANVNSDFGVLYNTDSVNMNIKNGQNLVFGFGNNISYDSGLIKIDNCINDDPLDGKNVNIDFDVNGKNIKLTLPDGSKKKVIIDAVAKKLDENNILYDKTDNGITIKSKSKLIIKHNNGDFFPSASAEVLTYKQKADTTKGEFTTINDFINELQNLANNVYPNIAKVGIDEKGKLYIQNDSNTAINAISLKADNTNDSFFQNLGRLGNIINPHTASSSLVFNHNYQGFSGEIVDSEGNKNSLKFDFIKSKIDGTITIWSAVITESLPDGKIVSTTKQDFSFDKDGGLLSPTTITINNNGTKATIDFGGNFRGLTSFVKKNTGFQYSQNGLLNGTLTGYGIDETGRIIANFSNGKDGVIAALPIFHFQNEQGLDNVGGQNFTETSNSGKALVYTNNEGKYISGAKIKNYALETSNVSMANALSELIVMQKAFGANAKSITTSDQMIQKAIDMKR
jgi:flagellar hook protein FlgE